MYKRQAPPYIVSVYLGEAVAGMLRAIDEGVDEGVRPEMCIRDRQLSVGTTPPLFLMKSGKPSSFSIVSII